jgi:hypothetical protein
LVNEEQIFKICQRTFPDIKMVTMSELSLDEQIQIFQHSQVIIGPHGQPFRNTLFSSNALIIQLVPGERRQDNEYLQWARNFNCVGSLGKNRCISLFNGEQLPTGASHWSYDDRKWEKDLARVVALSGKIRSEGISPVATILIGESKVSR